MQIFISAIIIIIYLVAIAKTWTNLEELEKHKKIIIIGIGIIVLYLVTNIIFSISTNSIEYQNGNMQNSVKNMLTILFTGINALIFIPWITKNVVKLKNNEIETKNFQMKLLIIGTVFVVCMIVENIYMKNIQKGILDIYNVNIQESIEEN